MAKVSLPFTNSTFKICSVRECGRKSRSLGYCNRHYQRFRLYGDPLFPLQDSNKERRAPWLRDPATYNKTTEERFWSHVAKSESCWEWTGRLSKGYGIIRYKDRQVRTHRLSYFFAHGAWPEPMCLHSCDNKRCVNPAHLRAGTCKDNVHDAIERGLHSVKPGELHRNAKLTDDNIREIRALHDDQRGSGTGFKSLAKKYGVHWTTIRQVIRGVTWGHVKEG